MVTLGNVTAMLTSLGLEGGSIPARNAPIVPGNSVSRTALQSMMVVGIRSECSCGFPHIGQALQALARKVLIYLVRLRFAVESNIGPASWQMQKLC